MLGMLIGLLSGMLMSIQGVFNAEVTKQAGVWVAAGFVQLSIAVLTSPSIFVLSLIFLNLSYFNLLL